MAISGNSIIAGTYGAGIYRTSYDGFHWVPKNSGLTNYKVYSLAIAGNNFFAGTDGGGIYLSTNNGDSWIQKNGGLPSNQIYSIGIDGEYIFAATFEDGIFRAKLIDFGITDVEETINEKNELQIIPNPALDYIEIKLNIALLPISQQVHIRIFNTLGECVMNNTLQNADSQRLDVSGLPAGIYIVRIGNETKMFVKE
ncbi:MAG: two component regulator propeller domain protein [Ignavibacteria bacterium]|nr:two component regulator propeller domain protein [Ignavibacteria bacterium]